jgi:hypothetical protein
MIGAFNRRGERKPAPWAMTFDYFDKLSTSYGTSTVTKYGTREQAITAAENASRNHNGGGIVVTRARAYPTTGWFQTWRTRTFNFPSRYNPS